MLIKDLSKELDAKAMTAVHGADRGNAAVPTLTQLLAQSSENTVNAGAGSAINNFNHVNASQDADQSVRQNNGNRDSISIALDLLKGLR
jgi:hypothetical protein